MGVWLSPLPIAHRDGLPPDPPAWSPGERVRGDPAQVPAQLRLVPGNPALSDAATCRPDLENTTRLRAGRAGGSKSSPCRPGPRPRGIFLGIRVGLLARAPAGLALRTQELVSESWGLNFPCSQMEEMYQRLLPGFQGGWGRGKTVPVLYSWFSFPRNQAGRPSLSSRQNKTKQKVAPPSVTIPSIHSKAFASALPLPPRNPCGKRGTSVVQLSRPAALLHLKLGTT